MKYHHQQQQQYGRGLPHFSGAVYQRGHGIGSLFKGLFRFAMPLIKQGAKTVGRQALQTGIQLAGDVLENKPISQSFHNRMREAGTSLKSRAENKMQQLLTGSGKQRSRKRKAPSSTIKFGPPSLVPAKTKRRQRTRTTRDIFTVQ